MKTLITPTAMVAMLATPALANKPPVKPTQSQCAAQVEHLEAQILMMKKELAILTAQSNIQHKKILKDQEKAG